MTALFYLLGFISGTAAIFIVKLILAMRKNKLAQTDEIGKSFLNIINY